MKTALQVAAPTLRLSLISAASAIALAMPSLAMAEAAAPKEDTALSELIVTATRRQEAAKDVPLSVTALSGDNLVAQNKDALADYIRSVPGVSFQALSSGLNQITIRGVTGGFQRAKAPVSFYVDDMPVISDPSASPDLRSFDIERVEVLRGPQGTLFGESAIGGVIRMITKKPDPTHFSAAMRAGYETYDHGSGGYSLDGMVNIPVNDQFALRASISRRDEGGYIDNLGLGRKDQNGVDLTSGKLSALYTVNSKLDVSATALFNNSKDRAYPTANSSYVQTRFVDEARTDNSHQFNVTVNYDLDWATLTSSSNYSNRDTHRFFDQTGGLATAAVGFLTQNGVNPGFSSFKNFYQTLYINDESWAQEVRLVSPADKPLRYTAGLYYFKTTNFVGVQFLGTPTVAFSFLNLNRSEDYNQKAIFGEAEFDFLSKFTAVAGVRETQENRNIRYVQHDDFTNASPVHPFLPATAEGVFNVPIKYSVLTPHFALKYEVSKDIQAYVSATRGFRGPGGNTQFNNYGAGGSPDIFGPETLWSYEVGSKGYLLEHKLYYEISAFKSYDNDRQETANPTAPVTQQFVSNVGSAVLKGVEITLDYRPVEYLTVGGSFASLDTRIDKSSNPALIGTQLTFQPKTHASAYIDFHAPVRDDWKFNARVEAVGQSSELFSATLRNPAYTLVSAQVGLTNPDWAVSLYVHNLADKFIQYYNGIPGSPRQIGFNITHNFN